MPSLPESVFSSDIMVAIIGALVGAALVGVTASLAARITTQSKDIVEERRKWRDQIRSLAEETMALTLHQPLTPAEFSKVKTAFILRLNPSSSVYDRAIIEALDELEKSSSVSNREAFLDHVARLLKHDWERVKHDSGFRIWQMVSFVKCPPNEDKIRQANGQMSFNRGCELRWGILLVLIALSAFAYAVQRY